MQWACGTWPAQPRGAILGQSMALGAALTGRRAVVPIADSDFSFVFAWAFHL